MFNPPKGALLSLGDRGKGERRSSLLAPPSPNLANIHPRAGSWLAAYLWACGGKRASQALLFVLCLPTWYPVGELFSPDIPIPPELARWSRQRASDMRSTHRRICVCGNEAGVGYWRWVQIRQGRGHRWCLWNLPATVGLMNRWWQESTSGFILSFCGGGFWLSCCRWLSRKDGVAFAVATIWPLKGSCLLGRWVGNWLYVTSGQQRVLKHLLMQ